MALLISVLPVSLNAQTQPADSLKKVSADTLVADEDEGDLPEKVRYFAKDSTVSLPDLNKALLYGEAWVEYGTMKLQAAVLEIDYNTNIVKAYGATDSVGNRAGNPSFKEGDETMEADTIKYNLRTKKGKIYNALTRQGELLVIGNEIKKDSNDVIYMRHMKCIPCQEADAKTMFRSTKAKIIPDDKIVTGPMYLEIGGVPTPLGLPFGYFPNTKRQKNGVIIPQPGFSPSQGFNLKDGGYYFGISEKADLILGGDIFANGSFVVRAINNYNVLYKFRGSTFFSYSQYNVGEKEIPDDERNLPNAFVTSQAYEFSWKHFQDNKSNPSVRFNADVNYRKNQQLNRLNARNSAQYLQAVFQSNISFTKTWKFGALSLNGMLNQNAQTKQTDLTLPALTFNVNRFFPFKRARAVRPNVFDKIQMNYLMQANNTLSGHEDSLFAGDISKRLRNGIRHSLPVSTNFSILRYITATPRLDLTGYTYASTIEKEYIDRQDRRDTSIVYTHKGLAMGYDAMFSTALNTQVYFDYVFKKGKVKQIRHLLIPSVTYNFRPDYGAEHYGFWKSVQYDTLGHKARYSIFERGVFGGPPDGPVSGISVNLNNNLEGKFKQRTDTGVTFRKSVLIQNFSFLGGYNFAADSFKMSHVGASLRTTLFKYILLNANADYNPYVYDRVNQRTKNELLAGSGRALRFESGSIAVSTAIGSDMVQALKNLRQSTDLSNGAERGGQVRTAEPAEALPWTIRIGYNLRLTDYDDRKVQPVHALDFSSDFTPTKFWKVGVSSGYDFNALQLRQTRVSIYRDLKCWEARIDWVPFGTNKSYTVAINMKMSMLSDMKIQHQRGWYDNF